MLGSCCVILKIQLGVNALQVVMLNNPPPPLFIYLFLFKSRAERDLAVLLWIKIEEDLALSPAYGDHNS